MSQALRGAILWNMTNWPPSDPKHASILKSPSRRQFLRGTGLALSASLAGALTGCGGNQSAKLVERRRQAAWRRRRVILDDDGDLCYSEDAEKSVEAFLAQRFVPILETPVDSIAWCIMWAIAIGKGKTRYWETQQLGKPLNPVISDPTPVMAEAARSRQIELFGSLRMNDTHDSYGMPAGKLIYPLKVEHPEWLLGDESMKGPVFSSQAAAIWSGLDFAVPQVREDRLWWIRNTVGKYDVAGVDLNFFRMPWYFKTGKEEEGMPLMTDLIRSARKVLDRESERRGHPLMLGIRSPGTVAACRRIGIDIETWLKEGLVDRLLIGGGYVPFTNPAEELVQLGHQHQVPVYPCINCGTQMFGSDSAFRGAASNILWAGADGIYLWNFQYRKVPQISYGRPTAEGYEVLNHIGSGDALRYQDKTFAIDYVQTVDVMGNVGPYSIASYPGQVPVELAGSPGQDRTAVEMRVGDDLAAAEQAGRLKGVGIEVEVHNLMPGERLEVTLNQAPMELVSEAVRPPRKEGEKGVPFRSGTLSATQIRQGMNRFEVGVANRGSRAGGKLILKQILLHVRYS